MGDMQNRPRKLTHAVRIHMDVATTLLKDTGNRGVIIIAFGESGYETTVAAVTHGEAGPLAMVASVLRDTLKNADIAREAVEGLTEAGPDREINPHEGGGTGVVGTSG